MDLTPILSKTYPENFLGGECGTFAHWLIDFPLVGDSYASKKKAVQLYGVIAANILEYRIGDVLVTSEGTFMGLGAGHVCTVVNIIGGQPLVVESNFRRDGRVHYGRAVPLSKVYGLLRGKFKFNLGLPSPLTFNLCALMNYEKQWNGRVFQQLAYRFSVLTAGRAQLNISPLYTYNSLKNWWYESVTLPFSSGQDQVIAKAYYDTQVMPLAFNQPHIVIWSITESEWQGTLSDLAYTYPATRPLQILMTCEEGEIDKSVAQSGEDAYIHYALHEILHGFQKWGKDNNQDNTHLYDYQKHNLSLGYSELDWEHLAVNLFP